MVSAARVLFSVFAIAALLAMPATESQAWNPEPSQPGRAVFYPDEVEVSVEERLRPEPLPGGGVGFLLALPAGTKKDTFLLALDGKSAGGYFWLDKDDRDAVLALRRNQPAPAGASLPENEPSLERRALLQAIIPLADEFAKKSGAVDAAQSRIALWKKSLERFAESGVSRPEGGTAASAADEAAKLDEAYARLLPALHLDLIREQRALEDARKRLEKAQKTLADHDHKEDCQIVGIPAPEAANQLMALHYTYVLPASCSLSYRLGAFPDKEELNVGQDASVSQYSGFAWTGVELYISTLRRDRRLRPANLPPWVLRLADAAKPEPAYRSQNAYEIRQNAASPQAAMPESSLSVMEPPAPKQEEKGTFRLWSLGRQRIEHNTPVRLALAADTYKVKYLYTLRPMSNPKGFLTADVNLPSALELPPGTAQFSVDGAAIGRSEFSFNGDRGTIYFGTDPQITATMRDLKKSTGEQGFFSKEQTLLWHWQITLKSARNKPVAVMLEDPAPTAADEAITVRATSTPRPETVVNEPERGGASVYRWEATLNPGEPLIVDHKVEVVAPLDKNKRLDPGFRRK